MEAPYLIITLCIFLLRYKLIALCSSGENMVSKPPGQMETRESQPVVDDRVPRRKQEQPHGRKRTARQIKVSCRWRGKNRCAHTGARQ